MRTLINWLEKVFKCFISFEKRIMKVSSLITCQFFLVGRALGYDQTLIDYYIDLLYFS